MSGKTSLKAGPFREPAYSYLSSLWYTAFTLPFLAWDCSGCYMTTKWKSGKKCSADLAGFHTLH